MGRARIAMAIVVGLIEGCIVEGETYGDCRDFCRRYDVCVAAIDTQRCEAVCASRVDQDVSFSERMGLCGDCLDQPTCDDVEPSCWETVCPSPFMD